VTDTAENQQQTEDAIQNFHWLYSAGEIDEPQSYSARTPQRTIDSQRMIPAADSMANQLTYIG